MYFMNILFVPIVLFIYIMSELERRDFEIRKIVFYIK